MTPPLAQLPRTPPSPDDWRLQVFTARLTGYYPDASPLEGGFVDRRGAPLRTLQDCLEGKTPWVSVAMDLDSFPYGTPICIPDLSVHFDRDIEFRVVDTGDAFEGKGKTRMDICTRNKEACEAEEVNQTLRYVAMVRAKQ